MSTTRVNLVNELCDAFGIRKDVDTLTAHMDAHRKAPCRKDDIFAVCRATGIHVTTAMDKKELVEAFVNAIKGGKDGNRAACDSMIAKVRSVDTAPPPTTPPPAARATKKAVSASAIKKDYDEEIDRLTAELTRIKLQKARAFAATAAAK